MIPILRNINNIILSNGIVSILKKGHMKLQNALIKENYFVYMGTLHSGSIKNNVLCHWTLDLILFIYFVCTKRLHFILLPL